MAIALALFALDRSGSLTQSCLKVNSNRRSPPLYNERTRDVCQRWEEFARGEDSICP